VTFQFVRHNARNETVPCRLADEQAELRDISERSASFGTHFISRGDEMSITL